MDKIKCFFAVDLGATSGRTIIGTFNGGQISLEELTRFDNNLIETGGHFYWDIYALYNERNLEQAAQNRAQAFFSKKVLLFDWNGTPRFIVELDRPIKSITYDRTSIFLPYSCMSKYLLFLSSALYPQNLSVLF